MLVSHLMRVPNSRSGGNEFESPVRRGRNKVERSSYKIIPKSKPVQVFCMTQRLLKASEGGGGFDGGKVAERVREGVVGGGGFGDAMGRAVRKICRGGGGGGGGHLRRAARENPDPARHLPPLSAGDASS
jgi:hypothetical protein